MTRPYLETLEDLKANRVEILENIVAFIEGSDVEATKQAVLKAQKQLVEIVTTDRFTHMELDIWEAIEKAVEISIRPDVVDMHAINMAYARKNAPSSLR